MQWLLDRNDGVDAVVAALTERATDRAAESPTWDTVRRLSEHYPGDPGIAISTLMHTVVLSPGEAIYLPAGNIHAYLEGLGIEVMAASDNVLRGGLTPKHVDVPELMSVLDFRALPAPYLEPEHPQEGVSVFRPDISDFALTVVDGSALNDGVDLPTAGAAIVLVVDGHVSVEGGGDLEQVSRGEAVFTDAATLRLRGAGRVAVGWVGD
jgi:mannose-6-phosphate isomerase